MARSKKQKAKAKAARKEVRAQAKAKGQQVTRASVQQARQQQKSNSGGGGNSGGGEKPANKPSVAEIRAGAKASGQRIRDYKASQGIAANKGGADRRANATQTKGNISTYDANSVGKSTGGRYTHQDIKALKEQGYSYGDIGKHLHESKADNLGKRAQTLRDRYVLSLTDNKPQPEPEPDLEAPVTETIDYPAPTPTQPNPVRPPSFPDVPQTPIYEPPTTYPSFPGAGSGGSGGGTVVANPDNSQEQNVSQDNDINTSITGNQNTVVNNQDNSIRQYGGDNRTFAYIGGSGGNAYQDTPVSAVTMAGYYDVDDSPAAQAKRFDFWSTQNKDAQKRFAGQGLTTAKMFSNFDARAYTPESLKDMIHRSMQYSYDRADAQTGLTLGDVWRPDYAPDWRMPESPEEIENNIGEITEDAEENIENA